MKKFLAISLCLVLCLGALVSCSGQSKKEVFASVDAMYDRSQPTRVVAQTEYKFNKFSLTGSYTLEVGEVDGKPAAIYSEEYQQLRDIASGSTVDIKDFYETIKTKKEYIEGTGVRVDGGEWDPEGESFIPEKGGIAINLNPSIAENYEYKDGVLSFQVAASSTEALLGEGNGVDSVVAVVITTDATADGDDASARIIGVSITYTIPADEENHISEATVTISATYEYDVVAINIQ